MSSNPNGEKETLRIQTHMGDTSLPWQFAICRSPTEIVVEQARGPPEKFDPVVKRFNIEERPFEGNSATFHHTVIRRVWSENPDQPKIRSQRIEGHPIDFLYRDEDGWHIARPDPDSDQKILGGTSDHSATDLRGVTVTSTFLRSKDASDLKFTEEREYRVSHECLDEYESVYVLSYHEVNEESTEQVLWKVDNAVAYHLTA